jgi:hypothetical protein
MADFPTSSIIPKDLRQLLGIGLGENHTARIFSEPENKFLHRSSSRLEFHLGDLLDGYNSRNFKITATSETAV